MRFFTFNLGQVQPKTPLCLRSMPQMTHYSMMCQPLILQLSLATCSALFFLHIPLSFSLFSNPGEQ